jgi:hypothetical protein
VALICATTSRVLLILAENTAFYFTTKMILLILVALACNTAISDGIACVSPDYIFIWPLNNTSSSQFTKAIANLKMIGGKSECRVLIIVEYMFNKITIQFGYRHSSEKVNHISCITTIAFDEENGEDGYFKPQVSSNLHYVCANQNGCDYRFILDHIDWLAEANFTSMVKSILAIFIVPGRERGMIHLQIACNRYIFTLDLI